MSAMSHCGKVRVRNTVRGLPRYEIEVTHAELHKHQVIRGDDRNIVERRASMKAAEWDAIWKARLEKEQETLRQRQQRDEALASRKEKALQKEQEALRREQEREAALAAEAAKKQEAEERTSEAQRTLDGLRDILSQTLSVSHEIDWENLKERGEYTTPRPPEPAKDCRDYPRPRPELVLPAPPALYVPISRDAKT